MIYPLGVSCQAISRSSVFNKKPRINYTGFLLLPLPVENLGEVLAVLVDVFFVLDEFILHHLLEVRTL